MSGSILAAAEQLAEQLRTLGVRAYVDPAAAEANRPCLLVPPPAVDYVTRRTVWRLAALSGHPAGTYDAVRELDELLGAVVDELPIEAADPSSYVLTPDTGPVPAYLLTLTT